MADNLDMYLTGFKDGKKESQKAVDQLQKQNEELKAELYNTQCFILDIIPYLSEKKKEQAIKLTSPKEGE